MQASPRLSGHLPSPAEQAARRARNVALGLVLAGLVVIFYVVTMAKLGLHVPGVS